MRIIDPGHFYLLNNLDDNGQTLLRFVKRMGDAYPGNTSAYAGTTTQEVLRALIDRIKYVDNQHAWPENQEVIDHLRIALVGLEMRAARARNELVEFCKYCDDNSTKNFEDLPTCDKCGHIGCKRHNP